MTLWEETEELQVIAGQQIAKIFREKPLSVEYSFLGIIHNLYCYTHLII